MIPDPIEIMERKQEASIDRIITVDRIECYPCDDCGKATPLDDIVCMDPTGASGGICSNCFGHWMKEARKTDETR